MFKIFTTLSNSDHSGVCSIAILVLTWPLLISLFLLSGYILQLCGRFLRRRYLCMFHNAQLHSWIPWSSLWCLFGSLFPVSCFKRTYMFWIFLAPGVCYYLIVLHAPMNTIYPLSLRNPSKNFSNNSPFLFRPKFGAQVFNDDSNSHRLSLSLGLV